MMRYDLPGDRMDTTPPAPRTETLPALNHNDSPTAETTLPTTAWIGNRYFQTNPAKLLVVRKAIDPGGSEEYCTEDTVGLVLGIAGSGAHVRYWGETGGSLRPSRCSG